MNPDQHIVVTVNRFADRTILSPQVGVFLLLLSLFVMWTRREYVMVALIVGLNSIPEGVRIYLLGMNFPAIRILIILALLRVVLRREAAGSHLTKLDKVVVFYSVVSLFAHYLRTPSLGSIVTELGATIDRLGAYAVVRFMVRSHGDLRLVAWTFATLAFLVAAGILYESRGGIDLISRIGGISRFPTLRGGRFRAQGPYPHSILAGALWATVFPLIVGYRKRSGTGSVLMSLAIPVVVLIVYLTASSTPLMALLVGVVATLLYYQRDIVSPLVITAAAAILLLAIFWWHPPWFLYTKINPTGDSATYFRYVLVDSFVRHWRDWWLIGATETYTWRIGLGDLGLSDLVNQFVAEGVGGGVLQLGSFVAAIAVGFRYLTRLVGAARDAEDRRASWQVGVSLLVHVCNFLGVSYYGQVTFSWWMTLAFCASLYQGCLFDARPASETRLAAGGMDGPRPEEL